tara:strand:- start:24079 stop:25182 length:1104 start_codon:yes stop_codon:yes gene_type:complete
MPAGDNSVTSPFNSVSNRAVLLVCLALALVACYWLVQPFLGTIVLAILIGMLTFPLQEWLVARLHGRHNVAALLSCLLLFLLILIPAALVLLAVLKQGITYSVVVREWATEENIRHVLNLPWALQLRDRLEQILPANALDPNTIKTEALAAATLMGKKFAGVSTALLGSVTAFMGNFALLLFALFFVLRDHDKLIEFIRHALPLSRTQEDVLLREVVVVSKSALLGSLLTAVTQGLVGGFGLWMAGFPGLFWGTVMAFTSLIPVVGTALVWVPAAAFLFLTGDTGWAIFLVAWGIVVVGSIDNFLRPLFMQGATMNTVVVFFSLLGGLHVFGLIGLVYGPLVFSVTLVLFRLYESEFSEFLHSQDNR